MKCPVLYVFLIMLAIAKSISEILPQADTQPTGTHSPVAYRKTSPSQHSDTGIKRHIENIAQLAGGVAGPTAPGNSAGFIKSQGKMSPEQLRTAWARSRVQKNRRPPPPPPPPQPRKLGSTNNSASTERSGPQPGHSPSPVRPLNNSISNSILARYAGRNRLLVISALGKSDSSYQLVMSQLKADVYCEMAERHMHQIVIFHQQGEAGGVARHITKQGSVVEEPLDAAVVPQVMDFLKLEKGKFQMVLLKKTLQVEVRYTHPVRLETVFEAVDQAPIRRLEKARQGGFVRKCKEAGMEGQVVKSTGPVPKSPKQQLDPSTEHKRGMLKSTASSALKQETAITTITTVTVSSAPQTVISTSTAATVNDDPTDARGLPSASGTVEPLYQLSTRNIQSDSSYQPNAITYTPTYNAHETEVSHNRGHNQSDHMTKHPGSAVAKHSMKLNGAHHIKKTQGETQSKEELVKLSVTDIKQDDIIKGHKGKFKNGKIETKLAKSEKTEKTLKKSKINKKSKVSKEGESAKYPVKKVLSEDSDGTVKLPHNLSVRKKSLDRFISYFEKRRRLIVSINILINLDATMIMHKNQQTTN